MPVPSIRPARSRHSTTSPSHSGGSGASTALPISQGCPERTRALALGLSLNDGTAIHASSPAAPRGKAQSEGGGRPEKTSIASPAGLYCPFTMDLSSEIARRRTFAIISHPDAGKTTLTEKFLLYGNAIHLAGAVKDRKNKRATTSDWMELERQRGISVSSTVLQFDYNPNFKR